MNAAHEKLLQTLAQEILDLTRRAGYLPPEEIPYVPAVEVFEQELLRAVFASIEGELNRGLHPTAVMRLFTSVFLRSFEAVYQWHRSPEGRVDPPLVEGDLLRDDYHSGLPADLEQSLRELPTPALLFDATSAWIERNRETIARDGVDLGSPLFVGLHMTSTVAVAMALELFGYRD